MYSKKFGFFCSNSIIKTKRIFITPLDNFDEIISNFYNSGLLSNGWVYPKLVLGNLSKEEKNNGCKPPFIFSNILGLIPTHILTIKENDEKLISFLILSFGFLNGLWLSENIYSLHRRNYISGYLVDFTCSNKRYNRKLWMR